MLPDSTRTLVELHENLLVEKAHPSKYAELDSGLQCGIDNLIIRVSKRLQPLYGVKKRVPGDGGARAGTDDCALCLVGLPFSYFEPILSKCYL